MFCAVLAWSRVRFVRFAADESQATTLRLLAECFEALGGVPAVVLADRMGCLKGGVVANVVVPAPGYLAFAAHYGFRPDFCEAADPEIARASSSTSWATPRPTCVIPGAPFADLAAANAAAIAWCAEVNGAGPLRDRGRPGRAPGRPSGRCCAPLPSLRPAPAPTAVRTVDRLRTVRFGSARYSVPGRLHRQRVEVVVAGGELRRPPGRHGDRAPPPRRPGRDEPPRCPLRPAGDGPRSGRSGRGRAAEIAFLALGPVAEAFLRAAAAAGTSRLAAELALIADLERGPRPGGAPGGARAGARVPALPGGRRAFDPRRGGRCPGHREPGAQLVIPLPAVPVRPLAAYALEPAR